MEELNPGQINTVIAAPRIDPSAFIADDADIIGDVGIAKDCSIWFHAVIRADRGPVRIGEGSNVQDNAVIHMNYGLATEIGRYVTVGHGAIVHGACVGDGTLIGMGAILMNGSRVGKNCVIGAGALVTEGMEIPDNSVAVGIPAKVVKTVSAEQAEKQRKNTLSYIEEAKMYKNDPPRRFQ